jgi:hypothetical protein
MAQPRGTDWMIVAAAAVLRMLSKPQIAAQKTKHGILSAFLHESATAEHASSAGKDESH